MTVSESTTAAQPTTHTLSSHELHDTHLLNVTNMSDPGRNEDEALPRKISQRPAPSPSNKIEVADADRSTPPLTKRSSMRPTQASYSPSPLILGSLNMLPNVATGGDYTPSSLAHDSKMPIAMSAIEADKSSGFGDFTKGPASATVGRSAKFAGRQGWSFKGNSMADDSSNSGWDVADEMSRLQVSESQENNATNRETADPSGDPSAPHSGDSASSISPTAPTTEPGDNTLFSYSHSRSPSSVTTSSDGPASVLTPLHHTKASMDAKAAMQDDVNERAYASMERSGFAPHAFAGNQERPSAQHPVPQYPQNIHTAHMTLGPAPNMPLDVSAEHYDYRTHSLPSHPSANEDHIDYRYAADMGVRPIPTMPMPVTMPPQAVPPPTHYPPSIDYRYAPQGTYPAPPPPGAYGAMPPAAPQPLYSEMHHERGVSAGYPHGHAPHLRPVHHHSASDPAIRDAAALLNALQTYPPPHISHMSGGVYPAPYSPNNFYTQADAYTPALAQALARQLQYDAPAYLRDNHGGPSANNRKLGLYKTELCRSWEEKGSCRYGPKCQFAHGEDEIRKVSRHPKVRPNSMPRWSRGTNPSIQYKTEICRTFWVSGSCPYGKR